MRVFKGHSLLNGPFLFQSENFRYPNEVGRAVGLHTQDQLTLLATGLVQWQSQLAVFDLPLINGALITGAIHPLAAQSVGIQRIEQRVANQ
jgi:hypothetical protein